MNSELYKFPATVITSPLSSKVPAVKFKTPETFIAVANRPLIKHRRQILSLSDCLESMPCKIHSECFVPVPLKTVVFVPVVYVVPAIEYPPPIETFCEFALKSPELKVRSFKTANLISVVLEQLHPLALFISTFPVKLLK